MPALRSEDTAPFSAILFDLDGTLVDTIGLILASFRHTCREVLGYVPPDDVLLRNVGVPLRVQMEEFAEGRSDEMLTVYREYNALVHDEMIAEYPGTETTLSALHGAGFTLGVVTSKSRGPATRSLQVYGLDRFIDLLVTSDDTELHKPDPFPLLEAARRLGRRPSECAYVGDSPHDMTAAVAAGMVAIAALWGPFPERVLEPGPAFALSALPDLLEVVGGRGGGFAVNRSL